MGLSVRNLFSNVKYVEVSQARKDQMRENTRRHLEKMHSLKDLSFKEHMAYERRKGH